jgi:enoyl-CoA hydratase
MDDTTPSVRAVRTPDTIRPDSGISLEITDTIAVIRLDRPPANALDAEAYDALTAAAEAADGEVRARAVVVYGGDRVFAAGGDIATLADATPAQAEALARRAHRAFDAVARIRKPVVAAVTGHALGGGLELALCTDFRVCGTRVALGMPEIRLGVIPGGGGTRRLPQMIGLARARELIYSGRTVRSAEAKSIGLVDTVVPDAEVYHRSLEIAARYTAASASALAAAKQALDHEGSSTDEAQAEAEIRLFAALFGSDEQRDAMHRFLTSDAPAARTQPRRQSAVLPEHGAAGPGA